MTLSTNQPRQTLELPVSSQSAYSQKKPTPPLCLQSTLDHAGISGSEDRNELAVQEKIIEKGWETFIAVGRALAQIRDKRLYKAQHSTFADYCRERWEFARSHAYRLIGAAELAEYIASSQVLPAPTNEAQIRPLIGLEPEMARSIWKKATTEAGNGHVTAKMVKDAAALLLPPSAKTKTKRKEERSTVLELGKEAAELAKRLELATKIKIPKKELFALLKDTSNFLRSRIT